MSASQDGPLLLSSPARMLAQVGADESDTPIMVTLTLTALHVSVGDGVLTLDLNTLLEAIGEMSKQYGS